MTWSWAAGVAVRRSPVHGRSVYALQPLPAGTLVVEYRGERMSWATAAEAGLHAGTDGATYFFDRGDGTVIDGAYSGNSTRFLNHSCEPNCEAVLDAGRIYIYIASDIQPGAELFIDYALQTDDPDSPEARARYCCRCSSQDCRTSMLA